MSGKRRETMGVVVDEGRGLPREPAREGGVTHEEGPQALRALEAERADDGAHARIAPLPREVVLAHGGDAPAAADHDPVQPGAGPEGAVGKDVAEAAEDGAGRGEVELEDGQPVGDEAPLREPVPDEGEVLLGVEVHDPRVAGGGRVAGGEGGPPGAGE